MHFLEMFQKFEIFFFSIVAKHEHNKSTHLMGLSALCSCPNDAENRYHFAINRPNIPRIPPALRTTLVAHRTKICSAAECGPIEREAAQQTACQSTIFFFAK